MTILVQWSSIYLQFSSFNFLMSGLFGDILCLRFFLSWAYIWLFVNAVSGFPPLGELIRRPEEVFILHYDVLFWTSITLYTHLSKFIGIVLNEKKVHLPEESMPLWRMLYRNSGLSELLFKQYLYPQKFQLVKIKAGTQISSSDNNLYIILDGVADTTITLQRGDGFSDLDTSGNDHGSATSPASKKSAASPAGKKNASAPHGRKKILFKKVSSTMSQRSLALASGDMINVKALQLFRQGSESEAFANQTVNATAMTDMSLYRIKDVDVVSMARTLQTKQAYQGLLIFALTNIAEREIMIKHFAGSGDYSEFNTHREAGPDGRDLAFQPLQDWELPKPVMSGSGMALTIPFKHFAMALKNSFRPPWPIVRWVPGLRHAAMPAPHLLPPEGIMSTQKDNISSLTDDFDSDHNGSKGGDVPFYGSTINAGELEPILSARLMELESARLMELDDGGSENKPAGEQKNPGGGHSFWSLFGAN